MCHINSCPSCIQLEMFRFAIPPEIGRNLQHAFVFAIIFSDINGGRQRRGMCVWAGRRWGRQEVEGEERERDYSVIL